MRIAIEVEVKPEELELLLDHLRQYRECDITQTLALDNPARYRVLPQVDNYGQHAGIDLRTGRRGIFMSGFGFVAGAHIEQDGSVGFEHPWDNPLH
jgi:hypothetical protein